MYGFIFSPSRIREISAGIEDVWNACLDEKMALEDSNPLALGIARWRKELAPSVNSPVLLRDSIFEDDMTKTNLAAILEQHGLGNVRSL